MAADSTTGSCGHPKCMAFHDLASDGIGKGNTKKCCPPKHYLQRQSGVSGKTVGQCYACDSQCEQCADTAGTCPSDGSSPCERCTACDETNGKFLDILYPKSMPWTSTFKKSNPDHNVGACTEASSKRLKDDANACNERCLHIETGAQAETSHKKFVCTRICQYDSFVPNLKLNASVTYADIGRDANSGDLTYTNPATASDRTINGDSMKANNVLCDMHKVTECKLTTGQSEFMCHYQDYAKGCVVTCDVKKTVKCHAVLPCTGTGSARTCTDTATSAITAAHKAECEWQQDACTFIALTK